MTYDYIIIGGGLSGLLSGLYLKWLNPKINFLLLEKKAQIAPSHTWSCFKSDWPKELTPFLKTLPWTTWDSHEVHFYNLTKEIPVAYCSLKEAELINYYTNTLHLPLYLNSEVTQNNWVASKNYYEIQVSHSTQSRLYTSYNLIEASGWPPLKGPKGYQKFYGLEFKFNQPHGFTKPLLMDATIDQYDGFRFMYVLPFSKTELFVEETFFSQSPQIDKIKSKNEIYKYIESKNLTHPEESYEEIGVLPLPFYPEMNSTILNSFFKFLKKYKSNQEPSHKIIGTQGFGFHPVTGYSLPFVLRQLVNLNKQKTYDKKPTFLYYLLNRFLFIGAKDHSRWKVFSYFYTRPLFIIKKFYSGQLSWFDWIIFFSSLNPPIPLKKAISVIFKTFKNRE